MSQAIMAATGAASRVGNRAALVAHAADYSLGVLFLLIACKALAYGLSLSAFRGAPVFPPTFIGAALGIAASGLRGWPWRLTCQRDGHRCDVGGDVAAAIDLDAAGHIVARRERGVGHPGVIVAVVLAFVVTNVLPVPGPKEPTPPSVGTRPAAPSPPVATA